MESLGVSRYHCGPERSLRLLEIFKTPSFTNVWYIPTEDINYIPNTYNGNVITVFDAKIFKRQNTTTYLELEIWQSWQNFCDPRIFHTTLQLSLFPHMATFGILLTPTCKCFHRDSNQLPTTRTTESKKDRDYPHLQLYQK